MYVDVQATQTVEESRKRGIISSISSLNNYLPSYRTHAFGGVLLVHVSTAEASTSKKTAVLSSVAHCLPSDCLLPAFDPGMGIFPPSALAHLVYRQLAR